MLTPSRHLSTSNASFCNITDKLTPGVYAVHVTGTLPEHVVDDLEANGITYRPRESLE